MSKRDFECCAYRSKSGKTGCGSLRYYHDEPGHRTFRGHKFVEPEYVPTDTEIIASLVGAASFALSVLKANPVELSERMAIEKLTAALSESQKGSSA